MEAPLKHVLRINLQVLTYLFTFTMRLDVFMVKLERSKIDINRVCIYEILKKCLIVLKTKQGFVGAYQ